jgi:O-antigen/teichoic acid export membrane protein
MTHNKLLKELISKSFLVFAIRSCSLIFGFYFLYLISQLYGSVGLGFFSLYQSYLMILVMLTLLGTDVASLKFVSQYFGDNNFIKIKSIYISIIKLIFPVAILLSFFLFFYKTYISNLLFNDVSQIKITSVLKYVSLSIIPMSFINIHSESLRGLKKVELYSFFRYLLVPFMSIIFTWVFFFQFKFGVITPILSYTISIFIISSLSTVLWFRKINFFKIKKIKKTPLANILTFSFPLFLSSSMMLLLQWIDIVILGYYVSTSEIGVYNIIVKISMISSIILFSINSIAAPKFSELFTKNKLEELKKIIKETSMLISVVSLPILLLIFIGSQYILNFFGPEYIDGSISLNILILGQLVNVICGSVGYVLIMTENQKIFRNIILLTTVLNIILNIFLIPTYGILGAAVSSMICVIIWNVISYIYIYKKYNFSTIWFIN